MHHTGNTANTYPQPGHWTSETRPHLCSGSVRARRSCVGHRTGLLSRRSEVVRRGQDGIAKPTLTRGGVTGRSPETREGRQPQRMGKAAQGRRPGHSTGHRITGDRHGPHTLSCSRPHLQRRGGHPPALGKCVPWTR